jgi:hypothetical protein
VNGTDCPFKTRKLDGGKPDSRFYCAKAKASGLRHEVAVCIRADVIVWVAGPYLPGLINDLSIFRDGLIHMLGEGERVEADAGYIGECPNKVKVPKNHAVAVDPERAAMKCRLGRRQETVNRRLKVFKSLSTTFRHSTEQHSICFRASTVLLQLAFDSGERYLFDVREYEDQFSDWQASIVFDL